MFTGIIESIGVITDIEKDQNNLHFTFSADISKDTYIDQSIAHNGVCLTVIKSTPNTHTVTIIEESLRKTNFKDLNIGDQVNLERAMQAKSRMDGHIVQGHVDTITQCVRKEDLDGSYLFEFKLTKKDQVLVVPRGSICINGISLTVANVTENGFNVAVIPYTYEHTSFKKLSVDDFVNLEFDIIGKYVIRYLSHIDKWT